MAETMQGINNSQRKSYFVIQLMHQNWFYQHNTASKVVCYDPTVLNSNQQLSAFTHEYNRYPQDKNKRDK